MQSSHTNGTQPQRTPFKIPTAFAPIFIPLLFLAAAMSIPWTYIQKAVQRRRERRFADQMKSAGRLMRWDEFRQVQAPHPDRHHTRKFGDSRLAGVAFLNCSTKT